MRSSECGNVESNDRKKIGIVAYYVDVDAAQLAALKAAPALVWNIESDAGFAKASMVDNDKDWETLAWLASPAKRVEKCHEAAWKAVSGRSEGGQHRGKSSSN